MVKRLVTPPLICALMGTALLFSPDALANSISYACGGVPVIVNDGDPDDLHPDPDHIVVDFACEDIVTADGGEWSAGGWIDAEVDTTTGEAWLILRNAASWWKSGGTGDVGGAGAYFDVSHEFPVLPGASSVDVRLDEGSLRNPVSSHGDISLGVDAILRVSGLPGALNTVTSYNESLPASTPGSRPLTHLLLNSAQSSPSLQILELDFRFENLNDGVYLSIFDQWQYYCDGT